ncbi:sugar porter family MFS transporter [Kiritimatiella glycovorans]|uniref:Sugar transporter n=1 Tax=Kiritimatiella glycovorans TaxID=1307763 RepID=A0A0G3EH08_9BACT|nr:sugar porter family MFS transporter [Kiritimatiella glycovorans]AKJ63419.1 sugar transporter [Kiritimatiella glycovorans]
MKERAGGNMLYVALIAMVAALGGLLFGYDTAVISGAVGFLRDFFDLSPAMTGWAASSALIGCIFGAALAGTLSDRLGRKKTLIFAAVCFFISAVGSAMPRSLTEFVLFRILGGVGVGAASLTSPMYIAEVSPARIRGRMVTVNQFAIVLGMVVVYFVNFFIERHGAGISETWNLNFGWRWMFASESVPALLLFLLLFLVPESPRWLVKMGREKIANGVLTRVDGPAHAEHELREIRTNLAHEGGSLAQLFQPRMRILLIIGISLAILQQVTGINVVLYYAPEIFKDLGADMNAALLQTVAVGLVNMTFTVIALYTVDRFGRKPLMVIGSAGMGLSLLTLGFGFFFRATGAWALIFVLIYIACFAMSLGPVVWVVLSEIFPTRIRGRAMALSTVVLWISCYAVSQTFPIMNDHPVLVDTFNHAFPFWVYAAFCAVTIFVVLRYVPETKGKSLEEIERMWIE